MAKQVMSNVKCWLGGYDLSGDLNAVALNTAVPIVDVTTIEDVWTKTLAGIKSVRAQLEGFWEAGTGEPDNAIEASLGVAETPITFAASPDVGATAYTFVASTASYAISGQFGAALAFSVSAEG